MSHTNSPDLWQDHIPQPDARGHKYDRGHALIIGSNALTGATRLAAASCSRVGAGLVSVVAREKADIYRATLSADIMVAELDAISLSKVSAVLSGCGGMPEEYKDFMYSDGTKAVRVFDANAIPTQENWRALNDHCILTPHEGEFTKVFGQIDNKEEAAARASMETNAIVVLKGAETVIAAPDGRLIMNDHASAYLAKAGTGDVLAGMITGLVAQGMPPFEASCSAVWMHGEAGQQIGMGLVPDDIIDLLPEILKKLSPEN